MSETGKYRVLYDMLLLLPQSREWRPAERDRWLNTFLALLEMTTETIPTQREIKQFYDSLIPPTNSPQEP